jgi:hypothetical protein
MLGWAGLRAGPHKPEVQRPSPSVAHPKSFLYSLGNETSLGREMAYFGLGLSSPHTSLDLKPVTLKKRSQARAQILSLKGYKWLINFKRNTLWRKISYATSVPNNKCLSYNFK